MSEDTDRELSRYVEAIVARTFVEEALLVHLLTRKKA